MRLAAPLAAVTMLAVALCAPMTVRGQQLGTYLAVRIDNAPLPLADRVTDSDGTTYLIEFDRLVLSLRAGNRFRASVRYRRTLHSRDLRGRSRATPMQSMTVNGTFKVVSGEIQFSADSAKDDRGLRMLAGRVQGAQRITLPFDYRNGAVERHRTLMLVRSNDIL